MDLLHKRYASPFSLLDSLIISTQFNTFVEFLLNKAAEEKNEEMLWEFFLHKVYGKAFNDWKQEVTMESSKADVMDEAKKDEIIARSEAILNDFAPVKGGESG